MGADLPTSVPLSGRKKRFNLMQSNMDRSLAILAEHHPVISLSFSVFSDLRAERANAICLLPTWKHVEKVTSQKASSTVWQGGARLPPQRVGGCEFKVSLG